MGCTKMKDKNGNFGYYLWISQTKEILIQIHWNVWKNKNKNKMLLYLFVFFIIQLILE